MAVELPQTLRRDRPLSAKTEAYLAEMTSRRSKRGRAVDEVPAAQPVAPKREIKYYRGGLDKVTHKLDVLSCDLPIFALAPTKDVRIYERNGASVKIIPNLYGAATVLDKGLWIYCIGQLVAGKNGNKEGLSRFIEIDIQAFLKSTERVAYSRGVERLKESLQRLKGTTIETNVWSAKERKFDSFGLLETYGYVENADGVITGLQVELPDWVWRSVKKLEVLSIPPSYFKMRKTLERRLFEIGRKHCGKKFEWSIRLEVLKDKCGSVSELKEFKRQVKMIVADHWGRETFPLFTLALDDKSDVLTFYKTNTKTKPTKATGDEKNETE